MNKTLPFSSERLDLVPVLASHAESMFSILADEALYSYTGGHPPETVADVEKWFTALESRRSPDGKQAWLTWIIHVAESQTPIGYVQATIIEGNADVAWLIGSQWQRKGFAREAATELIARLRGADVQTIVAQVNPLHLASQNVARAAGLQPSGNLVDGEEVWEL